MRDLRSSPFEREVVLGDSITAGASAVTVADRQAVLASLGQRRPPKHAEGQP